MKAIGSSGKIEPRQARRHIAAIGATVRAAWASACKHDGIDPAASFVVFSDDNPFIPFHARAMTEYLEAVSNYQSGGYVGLRLV